MKTVSIDLTRHDDKTKDNIHFCYKEFIDFLIVHKDFIEPFSEVLTSCINPGTLDKWPTPKTPPPFSQIKKRLLILNKTNVYEKLMNEFENHLKKFYDFQKFYNSKGELIPFNDLRGYMLEFLINDLIDKKYKKSWNIELGCGISINKDKEVYVEYKDKISGETKSKKTVDVAAWCNKKKYGEFYEAKVSPSGFNKIDLKYLITLKKELDRVNIKSLVSCISIGDKDSLLHELLSLQDIIGSECNIISFDSGNAFTPSSGTIFALSREDVLILDNVDIAVGV